MADIFDTRERVRAKPWAPARPLRPPSSSPPAVDRALAALEASEGLARRRPTCSARHAPTGFQKRAFADALGAVSGVWLLAPEFATGLTMTAATAGFLALIVFRLAACFTRPRRTDLERPPATLPRYTIIAPLHREANVVAGLVAALADLDYPTSRLEILLAVEADDAATLNAARHVARAHAHVRVLPVPPGAPRTKPRALNYALAFASGDLVVVYDAEDRPHANQLRAAAAAFARGGPDLACVQAPLGWYNARENWLTRQFALEYAIQFHVMLPALARWGWAFPLGGTSNHFRRAALDAAGGWDPHNVTEDADLGFRLAEDGWRCGVIAPPTLEEATTTYRAWRRQRVRWIKGFAQTWLVRMRAPKRLAQNAGWGGAAALQLTIGMSILSSLLHGPVLAIAALVAALWGAGAIGAPPAAAFALPLLGYAGSVAAALLGAKRAGVRGIAPDALLMPFYWPLHTPAAVIALRELLVRPYFWSKTDHGVTLCGPNVMPPPRACARASSATGAPATRPAASGSQRTGSAPPPGG